MKKYLLNSPQQEINIMDSLAAEMLLDKALLDFQKEKLQQKIDQSLQDKNEKEFLRLTAKLRKLS